MIEFTAPEDSVIRSVTRKVTDRVTDQVTDNLDKKSMQILALITEDPAYTSTAIAERLSISRKTVSQRLKEMKEKDIIERIGSDRKGYWIFKHPLSLPVFAYIGIVFFYFMAQSK